MVRVPSAEADSRTLLFPVPALPCGAFLCRAFGTGDFDNTVSVNPQDREHTSPEGAL